MIDWTETKVTFNPPEHGWMEFDLEIGGSVVHHDIADTGNPLEALVTALREIAAGNSPSPLNWANEPGYFTWEFAGDAGYVEMTISMPDGTKHSGRSETNFFLRVFTKALKTLSADPVWKNLEETQAWSEPFPYSQLSDLENVVFDA